jgi:hypothetical protein
MVRGFGAKLRITAAVLVMIRRRRSRRARNNSSGLIDSRIL